MYKENNKDFLIIYTSKFNFLYFDEMHASVVEVVCTKIAGNCICSFSADQRTKQRVLCLCCVEFNLMSW